MPITINGSGTVTGISAGGLPDDSIVTADIAAGAVTAAKLDGAQSGSAPIYGCRAWVNFDGTKDTTGATSTANTNRLIRASGNVTSVLRNGTGDYTITFTTAMVDANYAISATAGDSGVLTSLIGSAPSNGTPTTSAFRFYVNNSSFAAADRNWISVAIFR